MQTARRPETNETNLHTHGLPIGLATVHGLAGFFDCSQYGVVRNSRLSSHECSLRVEVDIEGLDTWRLVSDRPAT